MKHLMGARTWALQHVWALLVALLVGVVGVGAASGLAWANEAEETEDAATVTVAVTVYDAVEGETVCNVAVTVAEDATVADALAAAGFTSGTQEESEADATVYFDAYGYGYASFLGKASDEDYNYWASFFDGEVDYAGATALAATVVDGAHYQFVFTGYSDDMVFSYDDYDLEDPLVVTVGLTIYDSADGTVVYNDAVEVALGATVADVLEAAGFTEAESESESSSTSYYDSWSCPEFLGKGYDSSTGYYWVAMYEGDANNYAYAYLTATVVDGGHYQYVYADYTTTSFSYDDYEDLVDPLAVVTVALTIVDETDGTVVYNGAVEVTASATVADVLEAAGFTEADSLEATAEDATLYYDSWSCPEFLGKEWDSEAYTYWVAMYEGDANNYAYAYLTATVVDGGHYQYIYTSVSTFAYTDEIADPLATVEDDVEDDADDDADDDAETEDAVEADVNIYDADATATLLENLAARFVDGGADEAISNSTVYAALALNALGLGDQIDTDAILASLDGYEETYGYSIGAGALAKYIMALTAGGYDCTELVAQMEALEDGSENVYSIVFMLAVYDYGGYEAGEDVALDIDDLIDAIISSIGEEGLVGAYGYYDTQTTAQAILALLPYDDDEEVAAAIETMTAAILAYQNEDGGFGYASYSTASNLDATANIVAALVALGYDAAEGEELTCENGSSPIGYLVAQADETLDGYVDNGGSYDEAMTSATVLAALAAQANDVNVYVLTEVESESDSDSDSDSDDDDATEEETATHTYAISKIAFVSDFSTATITLVCTDADCDEEVEVSGATVTIWTDSDGTVYYTVTVDYEGVTYSYDVPDPTATDDDEAEEETTEEADEAGEETTDEETTDEEAAEADETESAGVLADSGDAAGAAAAAAVSLALCSLAGCLVAVRRRDAALK